MRTHNRRVWPLFAGVAILAVLGLFVIHGTAAAVVLLADLLAFMGAVHLRPRRRAGKRRRRRHRRATGLIPRRSKA
jgi:hypothetical protein